MPANPLVSYYLELTINGTQVTGYSITDYKEGSRLKATVAGRLSPASEMYIEETGSLDGPDAQFRSYCYFSARLKLTVVNGKQRWSGPFSSKRVDGVPCDGGTMTVLDNAPPLDDVKPRPKPKPVPVPATRMQVHTDPPPKPARDTVKPAPKPPKDTVVKPPPKKKDVLKPVIIIAPPPKAAPAPVRDTNNCLRVYDWSTDSLSFDIWDGWIIDGDVVSLSVGGRALLDHVKLSEVKQHFSVPLSRGINMLLISLHEEGFDLPNTPNLILYDGSKKYELNIAGNKGEVARICIYRTR